MLSSPSQRAHDDGGDAVADEVGDRAAFAHEPVDAEQEGERLDGTPGTTASVAASVTKPAPVTPLAPFEESMATSRRSICWLKIERRVRRLREEERGHRHVDVRAVEIEAVAGRDDEADGRCRAAEPLHFLDHAGQRRLGRTGAEHEQEFVLDVGEEAEDREAGRQRAMMPSTTMTNSGGE